MSSIDMTALLQGFQEVEDIEQKVVKDLSTISVSINSKDQLLEVLGLYEGNRSDLPEPESPKFSMTGLESSISKAVFYLSADEEFFV